MAAVVVEHLGGALTRISRAAFNCYVVHDAGQGRALVIDPGTPNNGADAAAVVRTKLGASGRATVICTHGHVDHVGGVPQACAVADGYHLPAICEQYLAGSIVPAAPGPREIAKILPVLMSQPFSFAALRELVPLQKTMGHQRTGMTMPTPPAGFVADGDTVPGAPSWRVISAPGHTGDATCFYDASTATLFGGDSVLVHAGQAWFNPEITDAGASAHTEGQLRSLPVEHLFPGHGLPVSGTDLLGRARSFRDRPPGGAVSCRLARLVGAWG